MSRTNMILAGVLVALVGLYLAGRDWGPAVSGPAPRLFEDFNQEAADRIEIEGGWQGAGITLARLGSDWSVESAGGYPANAEAAGKFIEAVYHLRKENLVGTAERTKADTQTGEAMGRLVRVMRGNTPIAEFRVGKNPQGSYQEIFVRREGDDAVYRTRTVLPEELQKEHPDIDIPGMPKFGPRGFDWHNYVNNVGTEWVETKIWDLSDAVPEELWLTREDIDVKLFKLGDDKWELLEGGKEERAPADADASASLLQQLKYLNLSDVVGRYEDVRAEYGLEKPAMTLVMTLKKKIEKKEEPKEGEGAEDTEGGEEKKPAEEWKVFKRTIEVGKKIERPRDFRDGEVQKEEYYAVRIGGVFEDDPALEKKSHFVFLVSDYKIAPLKKTLEEFRQKPEDAEKKDEVAPPTEGGDDEGSGGCGCGDDTGCGCGCGDEPGCGCGDDTGCGCGCGDEPGCGCGDDTGCGCGCGDEPGCGCGDGG